MLIRLLVGLAALVVAWSAVTAGLTTQSPPWAGLRTLAVPLEGMFRAAVAVLGQMVLLVSVVSEMVTMAVALVVAGTAAADPVTEEVLVALLISRSCQRLALLLVSESAMVKSKSLM